MRPIDADKLIRQIKKEGKEEEWEGDEIDFITYYPENAPTLTDKEIQKWLNSKH